MSEQEIFTWFSQYAYEPTIVYGTVIVMMILSSFGFPIPEEITLISAGIVCYMGRNPLLFPPPELLAQPVNTYATAVVCFFSVFLSDFLVFNLGKIFGTKVFKFKFLQKKQARIQQVTKWTKKYGIFAAGIFRFTPGLRFPGHFACGMMGLSPIKFILVDGAAALISVPTQIILIAFYGEHILANLKKFKLVIFALIAIMVVIYFVRKKMNREPAGV